MLTFEQSTAASHKKGSPRGGCLMSFFWCFSGFLKLACNDKRAKATHEQQSTSRQGNRCRRRVVHRYGFQLPFIIAVEGTDHEQAAFNSAETGKRVGIVFVAQEVAGSVASVSAQIVPQRKSSLPPKKLKETEVMATSTASPM